MELYREPGYDKVTVAEIAERAGLTRRTFFRYFADKREVLFFGAEKLEAFFAEGVLATAPGMPATRRRCHGLAAVTRRPDEDPAFARLRAPASCVDPDLRRAARTGTRQARVVWGLPRRKHSGVAASPSPPRASRPRPGSRRSRSDSSGGSTTPSGESGDTTCAK